MEQAQEQTSSNEKITEALKLLESAAKMKKEELRNMIGDKYANLKNAIGATEQTLTDTLATARKKAMDAAQQAREIGVEKARQVGTELDQQVHTNPWPYIGGTAVAALLIGYILGRNK